MSTTSESVIECLTASKVIAVIRTQDSATALELMMAYVVGGLKAIELTTTIPGWDAVLGKASSMVGDDVCVGMGSVTTSEQTQMAVERGAKFIVSPVLIPDVVSTAKVQGVPVIPGALTPTEIHQATAAGAEIVKIFPVSSIGGPSYIRALLAPMPNLKLIPTGGVKHDNAVHYLRAGAVAIGMGSNLAPPGAIENKDWNTITRSVVDFLASLRIAVGGDFF